MQAVWSVVRQLGTIVAVLVFIIYIIASFLLPEVAKILGKESLPNIFSYAIIGVVFIGTMLFALPIIVWINKNRDRDKLIENINKITEKINSSNDIIEKAITPLIIKEAKIITEQDNFFNILNLERDKASKNIRLMNFAKTMNEQEKANGNAKRYYKDEISFYGKKPNVQIFKIVSIHKKAKFKECFDLAREAQLANLENFNLAYVLLEYFSFPKTPKITGVQIFDENIVILMDPQVARIDSSNHDKTILLRSDVIAQKWSWYYDAIWAEIQHNHQQWLDGKNVDNSNVDNKGYIGHILYSGDQMKISEGRIWENINSFLPPNEQCNDKELTRVVRF
jgi:hypothetical protein